MKSRVQQKKAQRLKAESTPAVRAEKTAARAAITRRHLANESTPEPKLPEIEHGTEVFAVDPLTIRAHFEVDYVHSYKQDTPFFHGLANRKLLGSHCAKCNYRYATPRSHCMYCGGKTEWFELPAQGRVHSWTVCYFAAQEFLKEVPFTLVLVEFDGVDTLFLSRLIGVEREEIQIGMTVKPKFRRKATWSVRDVYFVRTTPAPRQTERARV